MQTIRRHLIIGVFILAGLMVQPADTHALYSPIISQQVGLIKQHITSSQNQNGTGTIMDIIESVKAYDQAKREAFNEETGISGNARVAQQLISDSTLEFLVQNPFDGLFMVFNFEGSTQTFISNCLRDDIWNLETLRDLVGQEMVKAYMLRDTLHGNLLEEDYKYLVTQIGLLRKYGGDPNAEMTVIDPAAGELTTVKSHRYFFGGEPLGNPALNYYSVVGPFESSDSTGCPDGEFEEAIQEVKNAWEVFKVMGSGGNVEWGNIYQMAQANARIRARQWIKANQISLTLGGENGAGIQSLVKGGGWDKFVGSLKTELRILKDMVGPVTPFFDWSRATQGVARNDCVRYNTETNKFQYCNETDRTNYDICESDPQRAQLEGIRCDRFRNTGEQLSIVEKTGQQIRLQEDNEAIKRQVEDTFVYSITMDNVAEQTIYEMDEALWTINKTIQRGYEGVDQAAGEGIPSLLKEMKTLDSNQCANKPR